MAALAHNLLPFFQGHFLQKAHPGDSRVINQHAGAPEALFYPAEKFSDRFLPSHVSHIGQAGDPPFGVKPPGQLLQCFPGTDTGKSQVPAAGREALGGGGSDSSGRSRDHSTFLFHSMQILSVFMQTRPLLGQNLQYFQNQRRRERKNRIHDTLLYLFSQDAVYTHILWMKNVLSVDKEIAWRQK